MTDIDRLRELALAATPGPWAIAGVTHVWSPSEQANIASASALRSIQHVGYAPPDLGSLMESSCNAEFIASCDPQTILALLDRLVSAERERDELIHDIERHIAIASREAEARIQAERERDEAYETAAKVCDAEVAHGDYCHECLVAITCAAAIRALQTHKGEQ